MPPPMKYHCLDPEEPHRIKQNRGHPSRSYGRGTWEAKVSGKHLALGPGGPTQGPPPPPPRATPSSSKLPRGGGVRAARRFHRRHLQSSRRSSAFVPSVLERVKARERERERESATAFLAHVSRPVREITLTRKLERPPTRACTTHTRRVAPNTNSILASMFMLRQDL